jgi:hypothetical protein
MNRQTSFVMTQGKTWALTVISVALFVLLCWLFADGLLGPPLWNAEEWTASPLITYVLILLIIGAGWFQAQRIPAEGIPLRAASYSVATPGQVDDPAGWRLLMGNVFLALFWLPIRFFAGREWFAAGLHKITDPAWTGGGEALRGYWERAVAIPEGGRPPITYDWFRQFLQYMLDNGWYTWFAQLVAWGETLVGLGLPPGGNDLDQPGAFRARCVPGPGLEGGGLLGTRPLAAASAGHPLAARAAGPGCPGGSGDIGRKTRWPGWLENRSHAREEWIREREQR